MPPEVRFRDGVEIIRSSGERVVADARRPDGDVNVLSHAHGDHLYDAAPDHLVSSATTAALAGARRPDHDPLMPRSHPRVALFPSGHIPGSRAALIRDDADVLYTGDCSTRDRFFLDGFDPPEADILVLESTYGRPRYDIPPQADTEAAFVDWLDDLHETPIVAFGYALGRAQELIRLGMRSDREGIYTTEAVDRLNEVIAAECDISFETCRFDTDDGLGPGDLLVLPSQTSRLGFVEELVRNVDAVTVGASGWAVTESYRYRAGVDEAFPLSDHCDFGELLDVVETVDPDRVYTHHGFAADLAREIRRRLGYPAQALKQDQTTLGEF